MVVGLALLFAASGVAHADTYTRPAGNQQFVDRVIERALSQRGVPFKYGGGDVDGPTNGVRPDAAASEVPATVSPLALHTTADVVGFDASGLIVYAFAGVGVKMPRTSGEQYNAGMKVAPSQALPGDLIFYGPEGEQSVAMFVGNGLMVEATEPAVVVSPVRTTNMTPYLTRIIA